MVVGQSPGGTEMGGGADFFLSSSLSCLCRPRKAELRYLSVDAQAQTLASVVDHGDPSRSNKPKPHCLIGTPCLAHSL